MRYLALLLVLAGLNSCNTLIGIGRDTQHAWNWSKEKMQGSGGNSGGGYDTAPVY